MLRKSKQDLQRLFSFYSDNIMYEKKIWSSWWQFEKKNLIQVTSKKVKACLDKPNNSCYNVFLWRSALLLQIAPVHKLYWGERSVTVHSTDLHCLPLSLCLIDSSQKTDGWGGGFSRQLRGETSALKWIAIITSLHVPGTLGATKLCWQPWLESALLVLLAFCFYIRLADVDRYVDWMHKQ